MMAILSHHHHYKLRNSCDFYHERESEADMKTNTVYKSLSVRINLSMQRKQAKSCIHTPVPKINKHTSKHADDN